MLEKSEKTAYFILAIYNIEVVPIRKVEIGETFTCMVQMRNIHNILVYETLRIEKN